MSVLKTIKRLLPVFAIAFVLFYRSLFNFYTNDDFFHLLIARADSVRDFVGFFSLNPAVSGFAHFRPLTTQVYYFLGWKLFDLNPLALHVISFLVFFGIIYLIYLITRELFSNLKPGFVNQVAFLTALIYAVSATHFGQLYFLGAFQELGLAAFFFFSVLFFIKFLKKEKLKYLFFSLGGFLLSILSKETAVVLPFILLLIYCFLRVQKVTKGSYRKLLVSISAYFILLGAYSYMRFVHYGFASGDSYIWDFSFKRALNTLGWYGLWSFNIPEMLVDFVGPGLKFNPNLFKFYSKEILPIFILFGAEVLLFFYVAYKSKILTLKSRIHILALGAFWFIGTLVPVLFLPIHKFSFYLTVPLFGVVMLVSYLLSNLKSRFLNLLFLGTWILLSVLTLNLTIRTHWIVSGARTAKNVYGYFSKNQFSFTGINNVVFFDQPQDDTLPWQPTSVLKNALSDGNFFKVFYDGKYQVWYGKESYLGGEAIYIWARQFLGY